jgi:hypothetical protein
MSPVRILVVTPVLASVPNTGALTVGYQLSLMRVMQFGAEIGYLTANAFLNTDLTRARSRAVRCALDGCYTHLLFWDSDVGGDCAGALQSMLSAKADVVAAPYPRKNGTGRMTHEPPFVAMGFTLISESCMRRMWDAYHDELRFEDVIDGRPIRTVALFQLMFADVPSPLPHRVLLGEDFSFCERWLRIGGEIHVLDGMALEHVGPFVFKCEVDTAG